MRTYFYKLTSDRGGAPCAPSPLGDATPLLTLAICKPAIRRTAQVGDRIVGLTSRSLELREGYAPRTVIYAATVSETMNAREYYKLDSPHRARSDCIYIYDQDTDVLRHARATRLHADPAHLAKDLGRHPMYKNGRILLCRDFRYFGAEAVEIPFRLEEVRALAEALGQGHRNVDGKSGELLQKQTDTLFRSLMKRNSNHTPQIVDGDSYDHAPKRRRSLVLCERA